MGDMNTPPNLISRVLKPFRPEQPQPRPEPAPAPVVATTISRRTVLEDGRIELYEYDSVRGERTTILSAQDAALERLPDNPTPLADQVSVEQQLRGLS